MVGEQCEQFFQKKVFFCSGLDPSYGSKPKIEFVIFSIINQLVELKFIKINGGGTKGGTLRCFLYFLFVF
jgi:hypothetical protein